MKSISSCVPFLVYDDLTAVAAELGEAEDRWAKLQGEAEAA